jgi:hypothetical protein
LKIAYWDCFSGISGDMCLGSIVDAGVKVEDLEAMLKRLNIPEFKLETKQVLKNGIGATDLIVVCVGQDDCNHHHHETSHRHDKSHSHEQSSNHNKHQHLQLKDILDIIHNAEIADKIKQQSEQVFQNLANVESKIHRTTPEDIHFHEVGALDTIIDVVGTVIGLDLLGIEEVYVSAFPLGRGKVKCMHGIIPLPAPAALELLKGKPIYYHECYQEIITPTGAALAVTLGKGFGSFPKMILERVGYGAGDLDLEHPNVMRMFIGEIL